MNAIFFYTDSHPYILHLFFANIFISVSPELQINSILFIIICKSNKMEAACILFEIKKVELIFFSSKGMSRLNSSSCSMCAYNVNKSFALFVEK